MLSVFARGKFYVRREICECAVCVNIVRPRDR